MLLTKAKGASRRDNLSAHPALTSSECPLGALGCPARQHRLFTHCYLKHFPLFSKWQLLYAPFTR